MIINNIDIIAFGKLKDFHLDFSNSLNVIYGDVENGQDTIISFIKMVFYGAKAIDNKSDTLTNERLKYRPYDADTPMGGSIEFSIEEIKYKIERIFYNSNSADEVLLYNVTTDTRLDIGEEKQLGKVFFGMNRQSFERNTFISDFTVGEKSTQKLLNIISSYDENVSANTVQSRLSIAKESYLSKSGKIGILDKNKATLSSLYEDMSSAQAEESQKFQMQVEYEAVQDNRDEIVARYDELRRTLNIQQTMVEVNNLKSTVAKFDALNDLKAQIETKKNALTNGNVTVDDDFIKIANQKMSTIQQVGEMKNQYQSKVYGIKSELDFMSETLKNSYVEEHRLYDEAVEQIEFTHGHIENLSKAIDGKKNDLEELSEKMKDADVNFRVIDEQLKSKKELDQQRLEVAKQQLEEARQPIVNTNVNNDRKTFITWGIIIIALGILLTLTVNIWCVIVIGMGIVMAIINLFDKHSANTKAKHERIDEVAVSKANENIQNVRHNIEMEQYILNKKYREAKKQLSVLKLNEEQLIADCEKYQEQIKTLMKNLEYWENQKSETQAIFSSEQAKVDKKQNELNTILENISNSEETLCEAQNDILNYMSAFKPCSTLTEVSNLIVTLTAELENIKNLQNQLSYQSELLKTETNGQTYEELKEKLMDVTADFIEMCGKENPEPMSISDLAKLKAEIDDCQFSLNMQNADLSYINTDIRSKFRNRISVTEIEHKINHLERKIVKQEKFCHSLDLASEVLQQSINEIREYNSTFNESTQKVFNQLVDDTYESLAITKALDLATQYDSYINSWKYLSKGTMEQAYFSLRLGAMRVVSQNLDGIQMPLILDDTFIQYNNDNVSKGINFLNDYSNNFQVIIFTSHKNIFDTIKETEISANLLELS